MNWLRNFLYGRYGVDQFSLFLVILSVVLSLVSAIFRLPFLWIFNYIIMGYYVFRVLSKNIYNRQKENAQFMKVFMPVRKYFDTRIQMFKCRKTHRYYKCPNCKAMLRVPKGRGKIRITCPKCKKEFEKTT